MKLSLYSLLATQQNIDKACAHEDGDEEADSDINVGAAAGLRTLYQDHRGGIYVPRPSPLPVDLPACYNLCVAAHQYSQSLHGHSWACAEPQGL